MKYRGKEDHEKEYVEMRSRQNAKTSSESGLVF